MHNVYKKINNYYVLKYIKTENAFEMHIIPYTSPYHT